MVHYSLEEVRRIRAKGNTDTNWEYLHNMSQEQADAEAEAEEGNAYLKDDAFWENVEYVQENKQLIGVKLDRDVVDFYKKLGDNYQETMNAVLKAYMLVQEHQV